MEPAGAARDKIGFGPVALLVLGCLLFLGLRYQRLEYPAEPHADEGVYLHVARHLHDSGLPLSSWYFIHRAGVYPAGGPPYRQSMVQPGLPALLAPAMDGHPLRTGRRLIFLLGALSLACSAIALWRIGGPWAAAGCALFTGLSFSQLEYGTLIHTETPMTLAVYASLAALVILLPTRPLTAAAAAGALAGLGLYFRTNGVFLPLALACCLYIRRREYPRTGMACLAAALAVMGPMLLYSAIHLGSPLASDSGDILWAASLEDFRSAHAARLGLSHLVEEQGWSELVLRPFAGAWALANRLVEADHGRTIPLLILGLAGFWMRRKHVAVQALALGTLPTLAVTVWVSPVSWCDRYIHFLMPALYGMAGLALASFAARIRQMSQVNQVSQVSQASQVRLTVLATPAAFLVLALAFLPPHRYYQRVIAAAPPAAEESMHAALARRLEAEGPVFLAGTDFSRANWRRPFPGANLPARTPVDSVAPVLETILGLRPTHLILSGPEERALSPREADWLARRLVFREGPYAVFTLGAM